MTVSIDLLDAKADSPSRRTLTDLSLSVAKCKRIVLVTGAGISCSSGIPDFRSSDGLYNLVKQRYPDVVLKGRDLFDASLFRDTTSTSVFYTFISQLKQSIDSATPTSTHRFLKTLDAKGKLLRSYTQNIDGLEEKVGLVGSSSQAAKSLGKGKSKLNAKEVRNVQLHGDIHRVRCMACSAEYSCSAAYLEIFNEGNSPECPECVQRSEDRVARSARATRVGLLRPAIVLYDEPHPLGDDIGTIQTRDLAKKPDMLIIMGTSLKVHGLKRLVKEFAKAVHASGEGASTSKTRQHVGKVIFVNRTPPSAEWAPFIDYHICGETDMWVDRVIDDWKRMRPADWEIQQTLVTSAGQNTVFKVVAKPTGAAGKGKGKGKEPKRPAQIGSENVPPPLDVDCIMQSPLKVIPPPSSPGKRRQGANHYSDTESSPSKKHNRMSKTDYARLADCTSTRHHEEEGEDELGDLTMDLSLASPAKNRSIHLKDIPMLPDLAADDGDLSMHDTSTCLATNPLPRMVAEIVLPLPKSRTLGRTRSSKVVLA